MGCWHPSAARPFSWFPCRSLCAAGLLPPWRPSCRTRKPNSESAQRPVAGLTALFLVLSGRALLLQLETVDARRCSRPGLCGMSFRYRTHVDVCPPVRNVFDKTSRIRVLLLACPAVPEHCDESLLASQQWHSLSQTTPSQTANFPAVSGSQ